MRSGRSGCPGREYSDATRIVKNQHAVPSQRRYLATFFTIQMTRKITAITQIR